ncbi:MAG: hypothetical protein ACEPO8_09495 [Rhodothermaceae bacterium]
MKRGLIFILLMLVVVSCSEHSNPYTPGKSLEFKQAALDQLDESQVSKITQNVEDFDLKAGEYIFENNKHYIKLNNGMKQQFLTDKTINLTNGKRILMITIQWELSGLAGPIVAIMDPNTKMIIGYFGNY